MDANRYRSISNRIVIGASLVSALVLALIILVFLGTSHVINPAPGQFSLSQASWKALFSLLPLLAPFPLIYAAAIAYVFFRGKYHRITAAAF